MPTSAELRITGITAVITISGQEFVLTSSDIEVPGTPELPSRIRFDYERPYETAVVLGKPNDVVDELDRMFEGLRPPSPPPGLATLAEQFDRLVTQLEHVPVLNQVAQDAQALEEGFLGLEARLTVLRLHYTRQAADSYQAEFSLGLVFTPQAATGPRLFSLRLARFGAVFTVRVVGTPQELGLTPPPPQP